MRTKLENGERIPLTEAEESGRDAEEYQAGLDREKAAAEKAARKSWLNAHEFLREFTDAERNALANSNHVAGLALLVSSWQGEVWSDHEDIAKGMAGLVKVGILSQERHDAILGVN